MSGMLPRSEYAHASSVCASLETGLRAAILRTQRAIEETQAELVRMVDILNEGRSARGLPPIDAAMSQMGEPT